jgi:N-dimethylarginine dimethylaminohydrolase
MVKKAPGSYWTDEEIKKSIEEWKKKRPEKLKSGAWRVEDIPFYERERMPRADLWQRVDYLDEYDITWEKKWGASGIGKLRELGVVRPTEYDFPEFVKQDPAQLGFMAPMNLDKWQKEHDNLVQVLRENGVTVHYIDFPEPPISAYGPMRGMWAGGACVVWGGAIITRYGFTPLNRGREKVVAEWLMKMGCPILLTVIGKGVLEAGAMMSITDDCIIIPIGLAGNQEAVEQVKPVLEKVGITTILEVHVTGWLESYQLTPEAYLTGTYHPDMFMMPVDLGKILIYPGLCGWQMIKWFRDHKFELIPIDPDEQKVYLPSNLIILEPGKVIMQAGAKKTIAKVRKAGVEVIEVPYSEGFKAGGGIYCATSSWLVRDRGPKLEDMK